MSGPGTNTLYIAASVDGYIATEDGGVEWLDEFHPDHESESESGYEAFFSGVDCLVMGSNTYEQVLDFGTWPYESKPTYVLTHRDLPRVTDAVELVDGEVSPLETRLRRRYDHIWVVGGATVAQEFLRASELDELRLNVVPVLLGSGIALFDSTGRRHDLALVDTTTYRNGVVKLHYEVKG